MKGVPGLYIRTRAASKSYMLQRRIESELVKTMLGQITLKAAKEKAMALWGRGAAKPSGRSHVGRRDRDYIQAKTAAGKMADKTATIARYNTQRYLANWADRTLAEVGSGSRCDNSSNRSRASTAQRRRTRGKECLSRRSTFRAARSSVGWA